MKNDIIRITIDDVTKSVYKEDYIEAKTKQLIEFVLLIANALIFWR